MTAFGSATAVRLPVVARAAASRAKPATQAAAAEGGEAPAALPANGAAPATDVVLLVVLLVLSVLVVQYYHEKELKTRIHRQTMDKMKRSGKNENMKQSENVDSDD